jgi:hypothetical protein
MKFLAILVLLSALGIAACAAYFSIIGLKLLFIGGGISIVVMGTALEIGKIVSVTFLHQMWHKISTALKAYLIFATFLLIVITSIGIYGYLSAGYNATSIKVQEYERQINSNLQKISSLETENADLSTSIYNVDEIDQLNKNREAFIQQRLNLIAQREEQIKSLRNNSSGSTNASADLVGAKNALDLAKSSLDTEVERELQQINIYNNRLEILDSEVQTWLNQGRGNIFRQNGIEKAREVRREQEPERDQIENQIKNAQRRIDVLREQYANQVREYNERVASIEQRALSQNQSLENSIQDIQTEINSLVTSIENYNQQTDGSIEKLNQQRVDLRERDRLQVIENQTRITQLYSTNSDLQQNIIKTDVGTFKFIAQSLNLELDNTVNYFIWLIMIVFDPLAVALILCFNYLIGHSKPKKEKVVEKIEQIVDNIVETTTPEPVTEIAPTTTDEPVALEILEEPKPPVIITTPPEKNKDENGLRDSDMYHTPRRPV